MTETNTARPGDYGYSSGEFYESLRPEYESNFHGRYERVDAVYTNEKLGFTIRVRVVGEAKTTTENGNTYHWSRVRSLEPPALPENPNQAERKAFEENVRVFENDEGEWILTECLSDKPESIKQYKAIIHNEDGSLERTTDGNVVEVEVVSEPYERGGKGETDGQVFVKVKDSSAGGPPQIREVLLATLELGIDSSGRTSMSIHEKGLQGYISRLKAEGSGAMAEDLQQMAAGMQEDLERADQANIDRRESDRDAVLARAESLRPVNEDTANQLAQTAQANFENPENGYLAGSETHQRAIEHLGRSATERIRMSEWLAYVIGETALYQSRGETCIRGMDATGYNDRSLVDRFRMGIAQSFNRSPVPDYIREYKNSQGDDLIDYFYACEVEDGLPIYYIEQRDKLSGKIVQMAMAVLSDATIESRRSQSLPDIVVDRQGIYAVEANRATHNIKSLTTEILTQDGVSQENITDALRSVAIDQHGKSKRRLIPARFRRRHARASNESSDSDSTGEADEAIETPTDESAEVAVGGTGAPATAPESGASSTTPEASPAQSAETVGEGGVSETDAVMPGETVSQPRRRRLRDILWRQPKSADTPSPPMQVSPEYERRMAETPTGEVSAEIPAPSAEDSTPSPERDEIPAGTFDDTEIGPGDSEASDLAESDDDRDIFVRYDQPREAIYINTGEIVMAEGYYARKNVHGKTKNVYEISGSPVTLPEEAILMLDLFSTPVEGMWHSSSDDNPTGIDRPVVIIGSYGINPRDHIEYLKIDGVDRPIPRSEIIG